MGVSWGAPVTYFLCCTHEGEYFFIIREILCVIVSLSLSLCVCVFLRWQASCGRSGLLTSVRRASTTPGYEVCCSDFTAEVCGLFRDLFCIPCPSSEWVVWAQVGGLAITLLIYKKKQTNKKNYVTLMKNTQRWLATTDEDQSFPLPRACPSVKPPLFSISRCHWKKPNVCLLSTILTSSLPPLSPSAPPVLDVHPVSVAEPARTALHSAVQRQPQRPQPHQFPRLLPWGVLPAADRTDQRDGEPGGQWPDAVLREGPGVLHCGPEGKGLISYGSHSNHFSPVSTKVKKFSPIHMQSYYS